MSIISNPITRYSLILTGLALFYYKTMFSFIFEDAVYQLLITVGFFFVAKILLHGFSKAMKEEGAKESTGK
nr:MAG TPA: hypothetical protein [Caudoviricetes sp.]